MPLKDTWKLIHDYLRWRPTHTCLLILSKQAKLTSPTIENKEKQQAQQENTRKTSKTYKEKRQSQQAQQEKTRLDYDDDTYDDGYDYDVDDDDDAREFGRETLQMEVGTRLNIFVSQ